MTRLEPAVFDALMHARASAIVEMTRQLVRVDSQTPPSATGPVAELAASYLADVPGIELEIVESVAPVVNVVASIDGGRPGPRLVLSGHLDTYPIGNVSAWSREPLGGEIADGRLWGRGSADMKGGVAVLIEVFRLAAEEMRPFAGSLALVLAGDEERMGDLGTQWLIDNDPRVLGDAVLVADVGGPRAIRLGEKGMIWLDVRAEGRSAHGAHVHAGVNAADRLLNALVDLRSLLHLKATPHPDASAVIEQAAEQPGADGPAARETMQAVTVNVGQIASGVSPNLVPSEAQAGVDIRLPLGVSVAEAEAAVRSCLAEHAGVSWTVTRQYEPTWTSPSNRIARAALTGVARALGKPSWSDMRIGGSDARLWRKAGMPCVVVGLTPNNLGAPDEYLCINELADLAKVYSMTIEEFFAPMPDQENLDRHFANQKSKDRC